MTELIELAPPLEVVIDYVDSEGDASRRHIMIFQIERNGPRTYLECRDIDIQQTRTFRLDRIQCFIDDDGVCHDPQTFIAPHLQVFVQPQPRKQTPTPRPAPRKVGKAAITFWSIIAAIAALSALMTKEEGLEVGLAGFTMLAGPVFLLRWIWRLIARRFG